MNIAEDENQPNDLLDGIPEFHFLNLEEEDDNVLGLKMEHNPDVNIKSYMFEHADALAKIDDSMADSLNNEFEHGLLFVHAPVKEDHMFFSEGFHQT